jgi:hypothetical protein
VKGGVGNHGVMLLDVESDETFDGGEGGEGVEVVAGSNSKRELTMNLGRAAFSAGATFLGASASTAACVASDC